MISRRVLIVALILFALLLAMGAVLLFVDFETEPESIASACDTPAVAAPPTVTVEDPLETLTWETAVAAAGPTGMAVSETDGWIYLSQQRGEVVGVPPGGTEAQVVVDLTAEVSDGYEQGLLGVAVSPDGQWLYTYRTDPDWDTRVDAFRLVEPGVVELASRRELLTIEQPTETHNGGTLVVDDAGHLYIAVGEGSHWDPPDRGDNAQSKSALLGSVLRILPTPEAAEPYAIPPDNPFVDDPDAAAEIWIYGVRNPWMISLDPSGEQMWVPDVGRFCWEEVNVVPLSPGGDNLGWKRLEGFHELDGEPPDDSHLPAYVYQWGDGSGLESDEEFGYLPCAIAGGAVYVGDAFPELDGWYVFADYCTGAVQAIKVTDEGVQLRNLGEPVDEVVGFATGPDDELYLLRRNGIARMVPSGSAG